MLSNTIDHKESSEQETVAKTVDLYKAALKKSNPAPNLFVLNEAAISRFTELGFPARKHEMFTFIDTRKLEEAEFRLANDYDTNADIPGDDVEKHIVLADGVLSPLQPYVAGNDKNVLVTPLPKALANHTLRDMLLASVNNETDAFAALGTAFIKDGVVVEILPDTKATMPIKITLHTNKGPVITAPLVVVKAGARSRLQVVVEETGGGESSFMNANIHFILEDGATLEYLLSQGGGCDSWSFIKHHVTQKKESRFSAVCAFTGSGITRNSIDARLIGDDAKFSLRSTSLLLDKDQAHFHVRVNHEAKNCESYQLFKNVVTDSGRVSVDTTVAVGNGASLSKSDQLVNNLLLTENGRADVKPNLTILNDDVKCAHGATTGKLDEEQVAYMKSRGIDEASSKRALVTGFLNVALSVPDFKCPLEPIKQKLLARMEKANA